MNKCAPYLWDCPRHFMLQYIIKSGVDSCVAENDTVWGIQWRQTSAGTVVTQKCPGLSESAGKKFSIHGFKL